MKLAGAALGVILAAVAAFLLWPGLRAPRAPERGTLRTPGGVVAAPSPGKPLRAPLTPDEELREEYSRKRQPFYHYLRRSYGEVIAHFAVTESLDTLDLVVTRTDPATLEHLVGSVVAPTASKYGFRKVRFYIANPTTAVEPLTLVAEAADDGSGRWNTFLK